jgi:hypothetical protein
VKQRDSFPFGVTDWRSSRPVSRMSMGERGTFLEMMLEQWEHGPLPDNAEAVALKIASTESQAAEIVAAWPVVRRKFVELPDGRIQNVRLEREREQHARRPTPEDTSPVVLTFPTSGKPECWQLRQGQIVTWIGLYPAVNVEAECRRALAWVMANGRKTAKGMPSFLVRWLSRSTDRRVTNKPIAVERRDGISAGGLSLECEHEPACASRWVCGQKQIQDRKAG